jgi:hypothetical protein
VLSKPSADSFAVGRRQKKEQNRISIRIVCKLDRESDRESYVKTFPYKVQVCT